MEDRMDIEKLDPGAAALLWTSTYIAVHFFQEPELKKAFLKASKRYAEHAPKGALYEAALKRRHIKVAPAVKKKPGR